MTGGKPFYAAAYASFEDFRIEDLGRARRAWATESLFGLYEGRGDPRHIRKRIAQIKGALDKAEGEHARGELQMRLGRMHGDTAILRLGAIHEAERTARKAMAERALTSLRGALCDGAVPGGGVALLNAQAALQTLVANNEEERHAYKILARALEEPMRAIAKNAGYAPDVILERVKSSATGFGFDAVTGQIVDMQACGVLDSASVIKKALEIAIGGAALALTTDVIVHHKKPVECVEP
jgi:chaperonin GroEL